MGVADKMELAKKYLNGFVGDIADKALLSIKDTVIGDTDHLWKNKEAANLKIWYYILEGLQHLTNARLHASSNILQKILDWAQKNKENKKTNVKKVALTILSELEKDKSSLFNLPHSLLLFYAMIHLGKKWDNELKEEASEELGKLLKKKYESEEAEADEENFKTPLQDEDEKEEHDDDDESDDDDDNDATDDKKTKKKEEPLKLYNVLAKIENASKPYNTPTKIQTHKFLKKAQEKKKTQGDQDTLLKNLIEKLEAELNDENSSSTNNEPEMRELASIRNQGKIVLKMVFTIDIADTAKKDASAYAKKLLQETSQAAQKSASAYLANKLSTLSVIKTFGPLAFAMALHQSICVYLGRNTRAGRSVFLMQGLYASLPITLAAVYNFTLLVRSEASAAAKEISQIEAPLRNVKTFMHASSS